MKSILRRLTNRLNRESSSPNETKNVELENLESRLLFSAAPVEAPAEEVESEAPAADVQVDAQSAQASAAAVTETESASETSANSDPLAASGQSGVSVNQGVTLLNVDETAGQLNQETLEAVAEAAAERWRATGLSAEQEAALDQINYNVENLNSFAIGEADGHSITLDDNAGGRGWFIDATPLEDEEFTANADGMLVGDHYGTDLLTVLLHEQAHVLGLDDEAITGNADNIMASTLGSGIRRLPADGQADGYDPASLDGAHFIVGTLGSADSIAGNTVDTLSSFTVDAGTNRLLIVFVADGGGDGPGGGPDSHEAIVDVTYNGSSLTRLGETPINEYEHMEVWYATLGTSGSSITSDVVLTDNVSDGDGFNSVVAAVAFDDVDQTTPLDGFVSSLSLSNTVTSEANGDLVVGAALSFNGSLAPDGSQTAIHTETAAPTDGMFVSSYELGAGSVTHSYAAVSGTYPNSVAFNINTATPMAAGPEIQVESISPTTDVELSDGDTTPTRLDAKGTHFGSVDTATGSETRTFRITNTGTSNLTLTGPNAVTLTGTDASHFSVVAQPTLVIGAGLTADFDVTYNPSADGLHDDVTLHIDSDDTNEADFDFALLGIGTTPATSLVTQLGTAASVGGDEEDTITGFTVGAGNNRLLVVYAFEEDSDTITDVSFDGTSLTLLGEVSGGTGLSTDQRVEVWYAKMGSGAAEIGNVVMTAHGGNDSKGSAVAAVVYENVDQSTPVDGFDSTFGTANFSELVIASEAGDLVAGAHFNDSVGNPGSNDPTIPTIGAGTGQTTVHDLDVLGNGVAYLHTTTEDGGVAIDTLFDWDDDKDFASLGFNINGVAAPEITVEHNPNSTLIADGDTTPSGITLEGTDFGSVNTASGMEVRTFRIRNDGNALLTLSAQPSITGDAGGHFTASTLIAGIGGSDLTLDPGDTRTFTVTFDPMADGVHTATVELDSDDVSEPTYDFAITGTGTTPTAPEIYVEHDLTDDEITDGESGTSGITLEGTNFGSVDTASGSEVRTFLIRNDGTAVLTISQPTLSDDTHFDVSTIMGGDLTLNPTETRTFTVTFDPTADGVHNDTVNLVNDDSDENPYNFAITGTGTTTAPPATEETGVAITGTDLVITDVLGGDTDDDLTISISGTTLTIVDNNGNGIDLGAVTGTGDGTDTVTIDTGLFTGGIVWDALDGNDILRIDFTPGNFGRTITYNGGGQPVGDELFLTGGSPFATATYNFTNENDGTVDLAGNSLITYTGLEPITSTITATTVTLNYSGVSETINVTAAGSSTRVDSTAGEVVTFTNPVAATGVLNINAGDGDDTINVQGFGTGFGASLNVNGEGGAGDAINYTADGVVLATDRSAVFTAERANFTYADLTTTTGHITIAGTGGSGANYVGVRLVGTDLETGTGGATGDITLTGSGGDIGSNNIGVQIVSSSSVTTSGGGINVNGSGGGGGANNYGVAVQNGSSLSTESSGVLNITGTGSTSGSTGNHGVFLFLADLSTVNGPLSVQGFGNGNFGLANGIKGFGATISSTGGGTITGTGSSSSGGSNNQGIILNNSSIDTIAGTGSISLTGTGSSSGVSNNDGVRLINTDLETGGNGSIVVKGTGGGTGAGANNTGVSLLTGSTASAAGSGDLTIVGNAGSGTLFNRGVYATGGIDLSTVNGELSIQGTGNGSLSLNRGVEISTSTVAATGMGAVTIAGNGSSIASGTFNTGVSLISSTVSGTSDDITITGVGGSGSSYNEGVRIQSSSVTTSGTTDIIGIANFGTIGAGNTGVYIYLNSTVNGDTASSIMGLGGGGSAFNHGIVMNLGITSNVPTGNIIGTAGAGTSDDESGNFPF